MAVESTVTLKIEGMTCQHCVGSVKERLSSFPGVKSVDVSLEKGRAVITGSELDPDFFAREVDELGFNASVVS